MQINGNEIELWAAELDKQPRTTPIPVENWDTFFRLLCVIHEDDCDKIDRELESKLNGERILKSRFELFGYKLSNIATVLVSLMIEDLIPGNLVIYANYLAYKCKINGWSEIDHDKVVKYLFPFGSFSKETLSQAWQLQKCELGNLLDNSEAGKSLRLNKTESNE